MLKSMTAFGRAEAETDGKKITVELRSVNSRYFECSVRMPRALGFGDDKVKSYLSSNGISRGKVDVNISVERTEPLPVKVGIDRAYADGYVAALRELSELYGLPNDISTMRVASNRDIFTFEKEAEDATKDWDTVSPVIDSALAAFLAARSEEGERLCADLDIKIEGVKALVDKIEPRCFIGKRGACGSVFCAKGKLTVEEFIGKVADCAGYFSIKVNVGSAYLFGVCADVILRAVAVKGYLLIVIASVEDRYLVRGALRIGVDSKVRIFNYYIGKGGVIRGVVAKNKRADIGHLFRDSY